ncbi:MAG: quinohemoprotein amine dehydrogenase subunit alpha [Sphingomonadales bacterium]
MANGFRRYFFAVAAMATPVILAGAAYLAVGHRERPSGSPQPPPEIALSAPELMAARCGSCHRRKEDGGFERIDGIRKTPEGWSMTLTRMTLWHGVKFSDDERRTMVKYLSNRLGLTPAEAAPYRYALEQDYNRVEEIADGEIGVFCARCHSYARIALQRRDEDEWRKLSHTHMGQYPSMEHQEKARNEEHYWRILRDRIPIRLDVLYPFDAGAWSRWVERPKNTAAGSWRITGGQPGVGRYTGTAEITAIGDDEYSVTYSLLYADGRQAAGEGRAILYTGYEWRGSSTLGDVEVREVFALSENGDSLKGRWFLDQAEERGARFYAVRITDGGSRVVAVEPPYLKAGSQAAISIHGFGLSGDVDLGPDVEIVEVAARSDETVTVIARAAENSYDGNRLIYVGDIAAEAMFSVYRSVDAIRVEPGMAIARVGDGGGSLRKIAAQFNAIAYLNGMDGKPGTDDDIRLGSVPAQWSVENFDETASSGHDAEFAGTIDGDGLFIPGDAGINPARAAYGRATNNVGNLAVIAHVSDGERTLSGKGRLIVTVQRWVTPPIR